MPGEFIVAVFLVLFSLLIHEIGHWAVLARLGVPVNKFALGLGPDILRTGSFAIGMFPIGAYVEPDPVRYSRLSPRQTAAVTLAGPWASALYGAALMFGASFIETSQGARGLVLLGQLNLGFALLNLLPLPPLDGWNMLCAMKRARGAPFSREIEYLASRVGNGIVYGVGFMVLAQVLLRW